MRSEPTIPETTGDRYGHVVGLAPGLAFVGANNRDNGRVYVFKQSEDGWSVEKTLTGEKLPDGSQEPFGGIVAASEGRLLVSGLDYDPKTKDMNGATYIYW